MDKKCLIFLVLEQNLKELLPYLKSAPLNLSKCKIPCKTKNFELETKNGLMDTFAPEFEKTTVIFKIGTFEFVKMRKFRIKFKKINLGPKLSYLGNFGLKIEKNYCRI